MFAAQLRNKLAREIWIRNEDLLTSAVFGTLKNLPPSLTATLLRRATPLAGENRIGFEPEQWEFWPWWQSDTGAIDGCEPDVILSNSKEICLLEAKLYSPFGSEPGKRDQLDREWRCGELQALESGRAFNMLLVTSHVLMPRSEVENQFADATANYDPSRIFWLNWTAIARYLQEVVGNEQGRTVDPVGGWCSDLLELIDVLGLGPFHGFDDLIEDSREIMKAPLPQGLLEEIRTGYGDVLDHGGVLGYADVVASTSDVARYTRRFGWLKEAIPDAVAAR